MTKGFSRATRAITWVASVATSLSLALPVAAFQQLPNSMIYEWKSQSGTDNGTAHVVNANAGDTVELSLTVTNRSQNPAGSVWYGKQALAPEAAPYTNGHAIGVGTLRPMDHTPSWIDSSSWDSANSNNNRFMYYEGSEVHPGSDMTLTWDVKIANNAANGTYDLYVGIVREHDEWGRQWKNGQIISNPDIFWRFNIGGGSMVTDGIEGSLMASRLAVPSNVEIGAGSTKSVLGVELEAEDSNIRVERVDVDLDKTGGAGAGDERAWRTFDRVQVLVDGDVVATKTLASADDFLANNTTTGTHTIRLSNLNFVVPVGDTVDMEIAFRVRADAAAAELNSVNWTATILDNDASIRGIDGAGLQQYASVSGNNDMARTFDVVDDDGALEVQSNVDSPESGIVLVDDTNVTSNQHIFTFDVEAGEADVTLDSLAVDVTVTNTGDNIDDMVTVVRLKHGNTVLGAESITVNNADTEEVTFDDLDFEIDGDDTVTFTVEVDLKGTANYTEGDTVMAAVDGTKISFTYGDDELGAGTGTATGEEMYLYSVAPEVELVSSSIALTPDTSGKQADGTIVFDVTARGGTIYFARVGDGDRITVDDYASTGGATTTSTYTTTAATAGSDSHIILEGQTRRISISFHISAVTGGSFVGAEVTGIHWGTTVDLFDAPELVGSIIEDLDSDTLFVAAP